MPEQIWKRQIRAAGRRGEIYGWRGVMSSTPHRQHITYTHITASVFTPQTPQNCNSHDFDNYPFLAYIYITYINFRRSQWPRGLRRRSVAARLLKLWVRVPPEEWTFICCECYVLLGRGLCDELITRPEESYRP